METSFAVKCCHDVHEGARYGTPMKPMQAKLNKREAKKHDHPGRLADRLLEAGHSFLAEDAFTRLLSSGREEDGALRHAFLIDALHC